MFNLVLKYHKNTHPKSFNSPPCKKGLIKDYYIFVLTNIPAYVNMTSGYLSNPPPPFFLSSSIPFNYFHRDKNALDWRT